MVSKLYFSPVSPGQVKQVQLYVSTDQGRDWRYVASASPGAGVFPVYTAPADGTYWFGVRAIDLRDHELVHERIGEVIRVAPAKMLFVRGLDLGRGHHLGLNGAVVDLLRLRVDRCERVVVRRKRLRLRVLPTEKRVVWVEQLRLFDYTAAATWRGLPASALSAARLQLKRYIKQTPAAWHVVSQLRTLFGMIQGSRGA